MNMMEDQDLPEFEPVLHFDRKTNLLEQRSTMFPLQDVSEPNLYRHLFDYESVPKTAFNHRIMPMQPASEIWMTDTTFRDGQQSRRPFTVEQIVRLFQLQHKLGGPNGLVRQSEFFVYSKKDREAVEACQALGYEFPEITTWIRATKEDFKLVKDMGVRETGILVSCSDYHIFHKMHKTRRQAMEDYLAVVKSALDYGIVPRCHFEDITRADYYGFVVPFVGELMKLGIEANVPLKIRACDTLGYGVTYPGAAMPRSVPGIIYGLRHYCGMPSKQLEWHGHNDFYKVVVNAATAWLYGCSSVNCSMLGIGERTGNCPLEAMAMEYASLRGTTDGMDLSAITEYAEYFEKEIGYKIPPRTPFVGKSFNETRAGIHADGLLKDEEIYNIFNTGKILNRPPKVMVGQNSGVAGIAHWVNGFYSLKGDSQLDKRHPAVVAVYNEVSTQYGDGRVTSFSDKELDALLQKADPELHSRLTAEE